MTRDALLTSVRNEFIIEVQYALGQASLGNLINFQEDRREKASRRDVLFCIANRKHKTTARHIREAEIRVRLIKTFAKAR